MLGAVCAAMAVQWTVARAVGIGVFKERVPFLRTAKGGNTKKGPDFPAFWEAVIAGLLILGSVTLVVCNYKQVHEINIFAFVLVVQSLPFIAAVALAAIEGTRFNSFAYWREIEATIATKTANLLPQRKAMTNVMSNAVTNAVSNAMTSAMTSAMAEQPKLPADNVEAAQ
jgi:hypothetical protein